MCGGWKRTKEETELRNHLKWARIEVFGDARNKPNEVSIYKEGYTFKIPIWIERQTIFEKESTCVLARTQTEVALMAESRKTLRQAIT